MSRIRDVFDGALGAHLEERGRNQMHVSNCFSQSAKTCGTRGSGRESGTTLRVIYSVPSTLISNVSAEHEDEQALSQNRGMREGLRGFEKVFGTSRGGCEKISSAIDGVLGNHRPCKWPRRVGHHLPSESGSERD